MRRILGLVASLLLAAVLVAPGATSAPVDDAEAIGAGWTVEVGGVAQATLVPEAHACFPSVPGCPEQETNNLLAGSAVGTTVSATALSSQAEAHINSDATATLQSVMQGASAVTLPATWNARGYSSVENFSALNGAILADSLEVETVSGTRSDGGNTVPAVASGVRVVNLRLAGLLAGQTLAPILPGQVNQELFNSGGIRIVYWETNWNPADATTDPDGADIFVNALHITAPGGIDIVVSQAQANSTFTPPPPPPPANDPPNAVDDAATTTQNTPVAIVVTNNDSDPDGNLDATTVSVTDPPDNGAVDCFNGTCTYTPANGFVGVDTFTYQVCDTQNECDTAVVTITVNAPPPPPNGPPVAQDDTGTTDEATPVVVDVTTNDSDPDGNLVPDSAAVVTPPNSGIAFCDNGSCTYVPAPGFVGADLFTYQVCDTDGACDIATVFITVNAGGAVVNAPPVAGDDAAVTNQGTSVPIAVTPNDTDPDGNLAPASVTVTQFPANGGVLCAAGICTYTPNPAFVGVDTFVYRICDTLFACDTALVSITVNAGGGGGGGNTPPVAEDDAASTTAGVPVGVNVLTNDSDADGNLAPGIQLTDLPNNGAVSCNGGNCTYTPAGGFVGMDTFSYQICDTASACDTATVTITVGAAPPPGNTPPVATDDAASTDEATPVNIPVAANDTDVDGNLAPNTVSVTQHPAAASGSVICSAGSCTFTPAPGFVGDATFTYRICDTSNACDTAVVTVTVNVGGGGGGGGNAPPIAQNDSGATNAGSPATISVITNDDDPDGNLAPTSVTVTVPPANGAAICSNGSCTYTPAPGFVGTDSFTYRICDTLLACDTALVDVTVNPVAGGAAAPPLNSPPVAQDDILTTPPGVPAPITVTDNDGDPDGNLDPSSVTVTVPPANGAVICSAGTCTYTPAAGFSGSDSFEYRVCDTVGACSTATVTVMVPAVNPPPGGGNGGNGGDGNGGGGNGTGNGGGNDRPDREGQPSRPSGPRVVAPAPDPLAPVSQPSLGAPNPLPLTGNEPGFYLTIATSLLLLGLGVLLLDRWGRALRWAAPCPAWHAHEEVHGRKGCPYGDWS